MVARGRLDKKETKRSLELAIEDMVTTVLNGELAAEGKEYKEFSLDYFGVGLSAG